MRVMVIVKASNESETGAVPTEKDLLEMGAFNDELVKAGVMVSGEGLHPSKRGARVQYAGGARTVIDGPFAETKTLVAGFWLLQVKTFEEAVEWLKRAPFKDGEVELRPVFEAADFGAAYTPEVRAQEDAQRAAIEQQHGKR